MLPCGMGTKMARLNVEGVKLAKELCALNRQRQELEGDIFSQCDLLAESFPAGERDALVLAGDTWHQGVVAGIFSSKMVKPAASSWPP